LLVNWKWKRPRATAPEPRHECRELGLPEAHIRAADPKLYFASVNEKYSEWSNIP
jgi:hypothetical protein